MIRCIGISHRLTPVHRREKVAVAPDALSLMLQRARERLNAEECVILSTCNRTEIYFVGDDTNDPQAVVLDLLQLGDSDRADIRASEVYALAGHDAATHLAEVAAGLDSLILGEHEIMGQVKAASRAARDCGCAGRVLTRLFDHALRAGKRARAETRIASGIFSVGHCAAHAAKEVLGDLRGKALLVIGAGRIAESTAKHLAHQGAAPVTVANRTLERAREVANRLGGTADTIANLPRLLTTADLVITCTSAPHFILEADEVRRAAAERAGQPLVVIDVSVPRDVDPKASSVAGVRLFNLDDLEPLVAENAKAREGEVKAARSIIAEEVQSFEEWRLRGDIAPLIRDMRRSVEAIRQTCLQQVRGKLGHLSSEDLEVVERLTDLLVKRLLHAPTKALRAHPDGEQFTLAAAVQELFELVEYDAAHTKASSDACRGATEDSHSVPGGSAHANLES